VSPLPFLTCVSPWLCPRQSPSLDNQSVSSALFLGLLISPQIHCLAMRHSHIHPLLRHSGWLASPHASNRPRQRVCVPGASQALSRTAACAQFVQVSETADKKSSKDEPYYSQPLGRPRATDRATSGLLLCRPAGC